jgi:hypothetical protein
MKLVRERLLYATIFALMWLLQEVKSGSRKVGIIDEYAD